MLISSYGTVQTITAPTPPPAPGSPSPWTYDLSTYGAIYRAQPEVRVVVDFLARNIAQLGLHVYRRVTDTDRERLTDHPLAQAIAKPNPYTTRYRMFETTMLDFAIYWNAYWLKVRAGDRLGLVRLPPEQVIVEGGLFPRSYCWTVARTGTTIELAPADIVHFRGYDPDNALTGISPMETLRRVLAESAAAADYRESFWQHGARAEAIITRPAGLKWEQKQRDEFKEAWQRNYGPGGAHYGGTVILEDGMDIKPWTINAQESEYVSGMKLGREICAASYHIPQPMVGLLDHATFSNIKEQHKQLYQDSLGPWLVQLEEDIELQLLPEFDDAEDIYTEFNIQEKLKGSFEEQAESLTKLIGRPVMTVNEGRARLNLPRHEGDGADRLALQPGTGGPPLGIERRTSSDAAARAAQLRFEQRVAARIAKPGARMVDLGRWTRELADDLQLAGLDETTARDRAATVSAAAAVQLANANGNGQH